MSNSKDQIGNTLPSSSAESTAAKVEPSEPSARTDNTVNSMPTLKTQSTDTSQNDKSASTTVLSTTDNSQVMEKIHLHATLLRVALRILLKAGLTKRYKVLSEDRTTVLKIRYEFDMSQWTEEMELK